MAKRLLRKAISKAKVTAWQELINSIDVDPWGTPYRLVLNKLQSSGSLTENLDKNTLRILLDSLFPDGEEFDAEGESGREVSNSGDKETAVSKVTTIEVAKIIRRPKAGNPAPGKDGITTAILRTMPEEAIEMMANVYNKCIEESVFPTAWKTALLVLIPKPGGTENDIPKARPICLLSEVGKILERIIADRLKMWMQDNPEYELADTQFGFREGRSTCDALDLVKRVILTERASGGTTVAVSLDIKNAFNSIPWSRIRTALVKKRFPSYLRGIISSYLSCRTIEYPVADGGRGSRPVKAGVPQGSVLGPLLWNIAFDCVLQDGTEPDCHIVCYADDTLVLASADTMAGAVARANLQVRLVTGRIRRLGLKIASDKTEIVLFHSGKGLPKEDLPHIQVGDQWIQAGTSMKYLGILLDSKLKFLDHFRYVEEKATRVSKALGRLMPNLRGPKEAKRRLYAGVVQSVMLYGAPIWCEQLNASREAQRLLDRVMRNVALRVISGYRTVSLDAAGILSRIPPLILMASNRKRTFERVRDLRQAGQWTREADREVKKEEELLMMRQWELHLRRPSAAGRYTREALLPYVGLWMGRRHGSVSFRLIQIMTGHGSFAAYLFRIGKADSPCCTHCGKDEEDTAEHAFLECEAWSGNREALREALGIDLTSVRAIIAEMCRSAEAWRAVSLYAETVVAEKERIERDRMAAEAARNAPLPITSSSSGGGGSGSEDSVVHSDGIGSG